MSFLNTVLAEYTHRGFNIQAIHADAEFACTGAELKPIPVHCVSKNQHVPEIERSNRTFKDDIRTTIHGLPYKRLPKLFLDHLAKYTNDNLNQFPRPNVGILQHTSPEHILTGAPPPDYNDLKIEFGAYVQIFDTTTNDQRARTLGAICLGPVKDANKNYYFMSLLTGREFKKMPHLCTVLPITDIAIKRLEQIAKDEGQPLIQDSNLLIEWRPDQPFDEDERDLDYNSDKEKEDDPMDHDLDDTYEVEQPLDIDEGTVLAARLRPRAPPPPLVNAPGR